MVSWLQVFLHVRKFTQFQERPALQLLHGALALGHGFGRLLHGKPGHEAKGQYLALVLRQRIQQAKDLLRRYPFQRFRFSRRIFAPVQFGFKREPGGRAALAAVVVHHAGVRHRKNESTEPGVSPVHRAKTRQDGEEHFLHGRLRILDSPGRQIAQDLCCIRPVDNAERCCPGGAVQGLVCQGISHGRGAFGQRLGVSAKRKAARPAERLFRASLYRPVTTARDRHAFAAGPTWQLPLPSESERAGLERDGGQVPGRRYIGVIAGSTQRVTPGRKNF